MKFFRPGYWQKLILGLVLAIQFLAVSALLIWLYESLAENGPWAVLLFIGVAFIVDIFLAVYIFSTPSPDVYKLSWLFLVFLIPIGGALIYIFFANKQTSRSQREKLKKHRKPIEKFPSTEGSQEHLADICPTAASISSYLAEKSGGGVHEKTSTQYFPIVDDAFPVILEELRKAKHFVFLEFFIVAQGKMWDSMLEILKEKAAEGVDVRFIYDDVGSLTTVPIHYAETLTKMGIKTVRYNKFRPLLDIRMNNRDHRKILVIDGHTCFSGGFNLADEYINAIVRFGHWKDNAILIRGAAVGNFTYMFLAAWASAKENEGEQINKKLYAPDRYIDEIGGFPKSDGFVQPYGDLPFDNEAVGERVYLDLINAASRYIYITTPYLIIDKEVENALIHAAHRGVDVRMLLPHIPDKKAVFTMARSFYGPLIQAGVHMYEYTPGFVHEKTFICDDKMATVGTINLDYRSLYLHLECGTFLCNASCIKTMYDDYVETLRVSHEVTLEQWKRWRQRQYWYWAVLRIVGPFL